MKGQNSQKIILASPVIKTPVKFDPKSEAAREIVRLAAKQTKYDPGQTYADLMTAMLISAFVLKLPIRKMIHHMEVLIPKIVAAHEEDDKVFKW